MTGPPTSKPPRRLLILMKKAFRLLRSKRSNWLKNSDASNFLFCFRSAKYLWSRISKTNYRIFLNVEKPLLFFPLSLLSPFATNASGFFPNCRLHHSVFETSFAHHSLRQIRNEIALFLKSLKPPKSNRQRRDVSLGLAALAAVGHSVLCLAVVGSTSCGSWGFLGIAKINLR